MGENIRKEVTALFSGKGDETIVDYVCSILEDDDFEFGDGDGDQVFEAIGPFLVSPYPVLGIYAQRGCIQAGW
eukprot:1139207-Pelagomonas_calceolata.AAC.1